MKISTLRSKLFIKVASLLSFIIIGTASIDAQVLLDSHSLGNGLATWNLTTTKPNDLIIISVGGYGTGGTEMGVSPGQVKVNGNNATYETKGEWLNFNFTWTAQIWAYVAVAPGVYSITCAETGLNSPFYFNYATSVYQNNCPLSLANIIIGGHDSNQTVTTITSSITTTVAGSYVYGTTNINDNGGTGTVAFTTLTLLDKNYINNGIDGAQAGATLAAGTYPITITDIGASNVWMTEALIAVQPNPNCCTLAINPVDSINVLCNGGSNGVARANPSAGHGVYTYSWTPGGQTTDIVTGLSAGTYTIVVQDSACSVTANVIITQPALPLSASIVPTNILCNGGVGSAVATAAGGTAPYTYSWSTLPIQTTTTATGLSAGSYTVNVTDANGCAAIATTTITQPAPISVSVTGPAMLCNGSSASFTATIIGGSTPYTYSWSNGATTNPATINYSTTQTYSVTVTDANGCTGTAELVLVSGPPLSVALSGINSMCSGTSTTLCATALGGSGGITYLWEPGNFTTPCIVVSPTSTTTYTISVNDNCGTNIIQNKTLNINPLPAVNFATDVAQGCAPLCIQLSNTTTIGGGGIAQNIWALGNGDTVQSYNPIYCYPKAGNYNVTLTVVSDSGCSATLTRTGMITVYSRPNAAFIYSPQALSIISPTVQFTDKSSDAYGLTYWTWSYGDGSTLNNNGENPSHTYQDTGTDRASMIVMNNHGCTDTATNCLVIDPEFNLYIPSAFSPNGNGVNDIFIPKGNYIKNFEMYIFDRWGMKLFYSNNILNGWDGRLNGVMSQEDTYVYKIKVTDSKNIQHSYIGSITLVR